MAQSDIATVLNFLPGPNTTGRLRDGDTDGLYWVRAQVYRGNLWRGPYAVSTDADAAAVQLLNDTYDNADGVQPTMWVEWGKRYWRALVSDPSTHLGIWTLIAEGAYVSVDDQPSDDDGTDTPPATQFGAIQGAAYAGINVSNEASPLVGTEHTDITAGLGGLNLAIISKARYRDFQGIINQQSSVFTNAQTNTPGFGGQIAVNLAPYINDMPGQLPISHAEMRLVESRATGRLVTKTGPYTGVTQRWFSNELTWPDDDTSNIFDVTIPQQATTAIKVGEWRYITAPRGYSVNYTDPLCMPAGEILLDNNTYIVSTRYKYRAVFSDGSKSIWVEDQGFFSFCNLVNGPFVFHADPKQLTATFPSGRAYDSSGAVVGWAGPLVWTFPMPSGAATWAGFSFASCYNSAERVGPGFSYRIIESDANGKITFSPYPGSVWTFGASVIWKQDTSNYANGATTNDYKQGPTWGYTPADPANPFVGASLNGLPKVGDAPSTASKYPNAGPLDFFRDTSTSCSVPQEDPDQGAIDVQGPYYSSCAGIVDVWFSDDGLEGGLQGYYNGNVKASVNNEQNPFMLAWWWDYGLLINADYSGVGTKGGAVILGTVSDPPNKIVVGYATRKVGRLGAAYTITYAGPHYASGPQRFYTDSDLNLTAGNQDIRQDSSIPPAAPVVPPFVLLPLVTPDASVGSISVTDGNGKATTLHLYRLPQKCIRINNN